jgi:hypothetical protein
MMSRPHHLNHQISITVPIIPGYIFIPIVPSNDPSMIKRCRYHHSIIHNASSIDHDQYAVIEEAVLWEFEIYANASVRHDATKDAPRRLIQFRNENRELCWRQSDDNSVLWRIGDAVKITNPGLIGGNFVNKRATIKHISPTALLVELPSDGTNIKLRVKIGLQNVELDPSPEVTTDHN